MVLMKIYGEAGLKELLNKYHRNKTAASVLNGTNFDKTLAFLLQCWEAFYRLEVKYFLESRSGLSDHSRLSTEAIISDVNVIMQSWAKSPGRKQPTCPTNRKSPVDCSQDMDSVGSLLEGLHDEFKAFTFEKCARDETFKFWHQFVHKDCFAYLSLYLAIRSGNWELRNYSLKTIAPLFHVMDSRYYYRLIPHHLADLLTFPKSVLDHFSAGGL